MAIDLELEDDDDDIPVGRILSRREIIALMGGSGLAWLAGCGGGGSGPSAKVTATPVPTNAPSASPTVTPVPGSTAAPTSTPSPTATPVSSASCIARPELTEGPYFVEEKLLRSDLRADPTTGTIQSGVLLNLTFNVSQLVGGACSFLPDAMLDIWHTNALGKYSDIASEGTSGQKFLRGYQLTDSSGVAHFTTIYPGWYSGRAVHIHFKLRATISGKSYEFTSQLFFNETLTTSVYTASPYNSRGTRTTLNTGDGIYSQSGGQTLLNLSGSNGAGYTGAFNIALDV